MVIRIMTDNDEFLLTVEDAAMFVKRLYSKNLDGAPNYTAVSLFKQPGYKEFVTSVLIKDIATVSATEMPHTCGSHQLV